MIYRTTGSGGSPDDTFRSTFEATTRVEHHDGFWSGTCTWTRSERYREYSDDEETYRWNNTTGSEAIALVPLSAPTDVTVGETFDVRVLLACREADLEELTVEERTVHSAPRRSDGSPSWYAYWEPEWPAFAYAYWETETGLLLAWRDQRHYSYEDGWMVDTDAPLPTA